MLAKLKNLRWWKGKRAAPAAGDVRDAFRSKYASFKDLLASNSDNLNIIADIEDKLLGQQIFGMAYVRSQSARSVFYTLRMVRSLDALSGHRYPLLFQAVEEINAKIKGILERRTGTDIEDLVLPDDRIDKTMVDWVGGKSANLGEIQNRVGLPIPEGFAITTRAFHLFSPAMTWWMRSTRERWIWRRRQRDHRPSQRGHPACHHHCGHAAGVGGVHPVRVSAHAGKIAEWKGLFGSPCEAVLSGRTAICPTPASTCPC